MTLEQLRIFVTVADTLHVTKAARALHLTQPAVSAAIAALEARYAIRLFHRVGRHIELSETGKLFLAEARAVLQRAREAETALSELAGLKRGTLAIHASQTIANYWLPPLLHRFRQQHREIALRVAIGNTAEAADSVLEGSAELGFVEGEFEHPALTRHKVADDELVLVVGPTHPWAGASAVAAGEMRRTAWVLREPGSGTRSEFEAALRLSGVDPADLEIELELPSNEAIRAAVAAGAGATVLSRVVVEGDLRAGILRQVGPALRRRRFDVLRHAERYQTQAAAAFLALIEIQQPVRS